MRIQGKSTASMTDGELNALYESGDLTDEQSWAVEEEIEAREDSDRERAEWFQTHDGPTDARDNALYLPSYGS